MSRVSTFRNREVRIPFGSAQAEAQKAIANPRAAAKALMKYKAEHRLIDFIRLTWPILEPAQPLIVGWAMEAICEHLEAVTRGQIRNLLINVPPGFSKSLCTNVFWPAWEWGPQNRPDLRYISWSYSHHLTKRDNERCRDLIQHPMYQALWGDRFKLKKDSNEKVNYKTDRQGFRLASSIGGVGTGERGDRLILDDPHSVQGAESDTERQNTINWFGGTLSSRVRNPNITPTVVDGFHIQPSSTVVIMQRVHLRDVSGVILDSDLDFEHLLIEMEYEGARHPARARKHPETGASLFKGTSIGWTDPREQTGEVLADPKRFPATAVADLKKKLLIQQGTNAVASQLRQWPYEGGGTFFKRDDLKFVDLCDVPDGAVDDVAGWDIAATASATADKTAVVHMRLGVDGKLYILNVDYTRSEPGEVDTFITKKCAEYGPSTRHSFPQDPGAAGKVAMNHLARHVLKGVRFVSSPEGTPVSGEGRLRSKGKRAEPLAAQAAHDCVRLVRGTWNAEFIQELIDFPVGQFDDFVDAATRAYDALVMSGENPESYAPTLHTYE